jgi:hypothetical protein
VNNPFEQHDLRQQLDLWLQHEVQESEKLHAVAGPPGVWEQQRIDTLKELHERLKYNDERSVFHKLDGMDQLKLKQQFPGLFDNQCRVKETSSRLPAHRRRGRGRCGCAMVAWVTGP